MASAFWGSMRRQIRLALGVRDESNLTLEDFRTELAYLGLLGRPFGPEDYRAALEEDLGIEIVIEEYPDGDGGSVSGELATEGNLAELHYGPDSERALILVRSSLRFRPWPAYELIVFHELSHLAARHHLRAEAGAQNGRRGGAGRGISERMRIRGGFGEGKPKAATSPEELRELEEEEFEPEAKQRAKWLVLAGTCVDAFEEETADRLT